MSDYSRRREIRSTTDPKAPARVRVDNLTLWNLKSLAMYVRRDSYVPNVIGIHLADDTTEARIKGGASVSIELYRLPSARAAFKDEMKFWLRSKRGFKVAGRKFEPTMLALSDVPEEFKHTAFQVRVGRKGGRIIHLHENPRQAILMVFTLRDGGDFLKNSLFNYVAQNVKIGPARPPQLPSAPRRTQPPERAERSTGGSDRPLKAKEQREVTQSIVQGYACLKLDPTKTKPGRVQEALHEFVKSLIDSKKKLSAEKVTELSVNLGCVWGQTVCDVLAWEWCFATIDRNGIFAIASPDRSHVIPPMHFIQKQLKKRGAPEAANTSLLLFNMLKAGSFPPARAKAYCVLG